MDEQRLTELFRTAAASAEPPPAGFDHDDVLAGSHRLARRQRVVVAAAVVAVAALGVGAVVGGGLIRTGPASTLAEAPAGASAVPSAAPAPDGGAATAPGPPTADADSGGAAPEAAPAPGTPPDPAAPRAAPKLAPAPFAAPPGALAQDAGPSARNEAAPGFVAGCARPDAEVFAQLTAVLPELRGRTPHPVSGGCAEGAVGVAVGVDGGTLAVVLTPAGVPDARPSDGDTRRSAVVEARSGRVLRLTSTAPDGPPPYRSRLRELADDLADRL